MASPNNTHELHFDSSSSEQGSGDEALKAVDSTTGFSENMPSGKGKGDSTKPRKSKEENRRPKYSRSKSGRRKSGRRPSHQATEPRQRRASCNSRFTLERSDSGLSTSSGMSTSRRSSVSIRRQTWKESKGKDICADAEARASRRERIQKKSRAHSLVMKEKCNESLSQRDFEAALEAFSTDQDGIPPHQRSRDSDKPRSQEKTAPVPMVTVRRVSSSYGTGSARRAQSFQRPRRRLSRSQSFVYVREYDNRPRDRRRSRLSRSQSFVDVREYDNRPRDRSLSKSTKPMRRSLSCRDLLDSRNDDQSRLKQIGDAESEAEVQLEPEKEKTVALSPDEKNDEQENEPSTAPPPAFATTFFINQSECWSFAATAPPDEQNAKHTTQGYSLVNMVKKWFATPKETNQESPKSIEVYGKYTSFSIHSIFRAWNQLPKGHIQSNFVSVVAKFWSLFDYNKKSTKSSASNPSGQDIDPSNGKEQDSNQRMIRKKSLSSVVERADMNATPNETLNAERASEHSKMLELASKEESKQYEPASTSEPATRRRSIAFLPAIMPTSLEEVGTSLLSFFEAEDVESSSTSEDDDAESRIDTMVKGALERRESQRSLFNGPTGSSGNVDTKDDASVSRNRSRRDSFRGLGERPRYVQRPCLDDNEPDNDGYCKQEEDDVRLSFASSRRPSSRGLNHRVVAGSDFARRSSRKATTSELQSEFTAPMADAPKRHLFSHHSRNKAQVEHDFVQPHETILELQRSRRKLLQKGAL